MKERKFIPIVLLLIVLLTACGDNEISKDEEDNLDKPISMIVPWEKGDTNDIIARDFTRILESKINKEIDIKNVPGTSGAIGTEYVKDLDIDAYTILFSSESISLLEDLNLSDAGYDDFHNLSFLLSPKQVILVKPDSKYQSLESLLINIKENPGEIKTYYNGLGTSSHLNNLKLKSLGYNFKMSLNEGSQENIDKLIDGEIDFLIESYARTKELIDSETLMPIAVWDNDIFDELKDVDLIGSRVEGLGENLNFYHPTMLLISKDTDKEVITLLEKGIENTIKDEEWQDLMEEKGYKLISDLYTDENEFWDNYVEYVLSIMKSEGVIGN